MNEKNTPRDFFLHIGAFAALYFGAIALLTLLFNVIDYSLPDALGMVYVDPYSGTLRFSVASLIVLTPLFLYFMRTIQAETVKNPDRKMLGVRKWLTYITLFISGVTIVGDLIALLNSYLSGSLPTPFLLKVVALFVVMGLGFAYFFLDIRGYWQNKPAHSRLAGLGLLGLVILSIAGAFFIIGSPSVQREMRFDNQQISDLQMIQNSVVGYWQLNRTLPQDLSVFENDVMGYGIPRAPEGKDPYVYRVTGDLSFELCAEFSHPSETKLMYAPEATGLRGDSSWDHAAGNVCFERTINPDLLPPSPKQQIVL